MVQVIFPNSEILECDVADNFFTRIRGLSNVKEKKALLFKFPFLARWSFWMPNMHYPVYLIFMDFKKQVVDIKYAKPLGLNIKNWKVYKPKRACKFVLETPFKHDVKEGCILKFE
ncbi:MAG: DUF192 domain-containing protein [Candidatus Nanoarchaeia archaeon]